MDIKDRYKKIKTCLYNKSTKSIEDILFVYFSKVSHNQSGFWSDLVDDLYYYYDAIIVKAIYILDDKRAGFNNEINVENIELIKKVSIILKNFYYDLQRFEASVYHLMNILDEHELKDPVITEIISFCELEDISVKSRYKEKNKYLFGKMNFKNKFNNVNYYLSNILIFFLNYVEKSKIENIEKDIEVFKNKKIEYFKSIVKESMQYFGDINNAFVELLQEEKFYDR